MGWAHVSVVSEAGVSECMIASKVALVGEVTKELGMSPRARPQGSWLLGTRGVLDSFDPHCTSVYTYSNGWMFILTSQRGEQVEAVGATCVPVSVACVYLCYLCGWSCTYMVYTLCVCAYWEYIFSFSADWNWGRELKEPHLLHTPSQILRSYLVSRWNRSKSSVCPKTKEVLVTEK